MRALFSFDTEDFVTPETDDALKSIADILYKRGISGSFAMVGDKARALLTRGRRDVIESLKKHDIQYHANTHLCWPATTAELAKMKWDEGVSFTMETERHGVEDVSEIFGQQPVAWIRSGGNWAPQYIYGLRLLGIKEYTPSRCVLPGGEPSWYTNVLNARYDVAVDGYFKRETPEEDVKRDFLAALEKYGDISLPISFSAHPCMFATDIFYDTFNQSDRGVYPPKDKWKPCPVLPKREINRRLGLLDSIAKYVMKQPGAETVTHREVIEAHSEDVIWLTRKQIAAISRKIQETFDAIKTGKTWLSPADVAGALLLALSYLTAGCETPKRIPVRRLVGPPEPCARLKNDRALSIGELTEVCRQVEHEINLYHRIPSFVKLDGGRIPPSSWLCAMAEAFEQYEAGEKPRPILRPRPAYPRLQKALFDKVEVGSSELPRDFDCGFIRRYSRLQTWSMRPASAEW